MKVNVFLIVLFSAAALILYFSYIYSADDFLFATIQSLFSAVCSLIMAILAINIYFHFHDRKSAARPFLAMVEEVVEPLHNECFILIGRDRFGTEKFNSLIESYANHGGLPDAFAPPDRQALYSMITDQKERLISLYHQADMVGRDLSYTLTWNFDHELTRSLISARGAIFQMINLLNQEQHSRNDEKKRSLNFILTSTYS